MLEVTNIFDEYAMVDAEIAALELKKSQLKPFILKRLAEDGVKNMKTSVGTFSLSNRKVWTYPEEVKEKVDELNDEIKTIKAKAESSKDATYEEVPSLRFTAVKL